MQVDVSRQRRGLRQMAAPERQPLLAIRFFKIYDELQSAQKSCIDVFAKVGGQNRQPLELFQARQQVCRFEVGVTVVGVADFGAFAEEGVRFIEKERGLRAFGRVED